MTLPSLINKAEKMILKNQFKKTYSTLTQALDKSVADLGYVPMCGYSANSSSATSGINGSVSENIDCIELRRVLFKNLNIIQTCENNAYAKGCIPKYKGFEDIQMEKNPDMSKDEALEAIVGVAGFNSNNILNRNIVYVLADGNILISFSYYFTWHIFAVDINGKKGPNKWGYDLFAFLLGRNQKSGTLILLGGSYPVEKGGVSTPQMIKEMHNK